MKTISVVIIASMLIGLSFVEITRANPFSFAPSLPEILISSDGSVSPSTDIIKREGNTYYLTMDISGSYCIRIRCNNIVFDGAGHSINSGDYRWALGLIIAYVDNVIVKNVRIQNFYRGIELYDASDCLIENATVSNNQRGIQLENSNLNQVTNCAIHNNDYGVYIEFSNNNILTNNFVISNQRSIYIFNCQNNTFSINTIETSALAIDLEHAEEAGGLENATPSNNTFYSNNFINNYQQLSCKLIEKGGTIDDSYPNYWSYNGKGNYWSDYSGNGAYIIDENNVDYYPLTQIVINSPTPSQIPILTPTPTPNSTADKTTEPTANETSQKLQLEAIIGAVVAVVLLGAVLLVYFKKRKH